MNSLDIFTLALGLQSPWQVSKVEFLQSESNEKELHIWLNFTKGYKFSINGLPSQTAYDTVEKTWRHLNFFQHKCYLHARVPRIRISETEIKMVEVPWARPNSGFTMLFEAYAMLLIEDEMPVSSVSETLKETAPRIWRIFKHWVGKALDNINLTHLQHVGIDETSQKKGHNYITHFVDLETRKTIFVADGKGADVFTLFKDELIKRGGSVDNIKVLSMDMSPAFISGALTEFPKASIIFDKFHIFKALNEALDKVRKLEHKEKKSLKKQRFILLHLRKNLSLEKQQQLDELLLTYPTIGKAYSFRESFHDIFNNNTDENEALNSLDVWCKMVVDSTIVPMVEFANMVKAHISGIKNLIKYKQINNGILEGLNSIIQLAKRRARGYANSDNFKYMIYLVAGKLKFNYPLDLL